MLEDSSANLSISGNGVDPKSCTAILGISPTYAWTKGDAYCYKHNGQKAYRYNNLCLFESSLPSPCGPNEQAREILRVFRGKEKAFRKIHDTGEVEVTFRIECDTTCGTYCFDRFLVRQFLELGVDNMAHCYIGSCVRVIADAKDFGIDYREELSRGVHASVYLRIEGTDVTSEQCSSILGFDPVAAGERDRCLFGFSQHTLCREAGAWMFEVTSADSPYEPEKLVRPMLCMLNGRTREIDRIHRMGDVAITFGIKWVVSHGTYYLDRDILQGILQLGIDNIAYSYVCCESDDE